MILALLKHRLDVRSTEEMTIDELCTLRETSGTVRLYALIIGWAPRAAYVRGTCPKQC